MDIVEKLESIVDAVSPKDANDAKFTQEGDLSASISWRLENDPTRKNKPSRPINIVVSEEVFEEISTLNETNREVVYDKISKHLSKKFKDFDPNHNTPHGLSPSAEKWVINLEAAGLL